MKIKIRKLHPDAVIPKYATDGSACFDLVAIDRSEVGQFGFALYRTGLAFEIPPGHVMEVYSRSGHGFKANTRLSNCVGIIDSDFRGEVMVKLVRDDDGTALPYVGERVAQAMIRRVDQVTFEEVEELSETKRGIGGMGSTGK